eukprot:2523301-Pleurochrysis_carterae.AAC.1
MNASINANAAAAADADAAAASGVVVALAAVATAVEAFSALPDARLHLETVLSRTSNMLAEPLTDPQRLAGAPEVRDFRRVHEHSSRREPDAFAFFKLAREVLPRKHC